MATKKKMLQAAAGNAGGDAGGGLVLHLNGKTDISGNSVTVLDYNSDVTTSTSIVPFSGATSADFRSCGTTSTLRVDYGLMADHDAGDPWCVEFWYYLTSNPAVSSPFAFNNQNGGNDMTVLFGHGNGMRSIGSVDMDLATVTVGSGSLSLNTWRHFCLSSNGTTVRFWIDGVVVDTFTPTQFGFKDSYLLIGNEADGSPVIGSGNLFTGLIADFRVWDSEAYPVTSGSFTPATSLTSHPYQTM